MAERDRSAERLAALTDGVVAIVMTLLCLDIRLPVPAAGLADPQLVAAIGEALPSLYAYALSFVVIAQFWLLHHRKFARLKRLDAGLFWLNVLFLMCIGVIPFVTSILAENPGTVGTVAYAIVVAAASLSLSLTGLYAGLKGLVEGDQPGNSVLVVLLRSLLAGGVFLISIPIAFWDADAAKYFWLLLIPAGFAFRYLAPAAKTPG
jgi:uncharacterized membrane protein